MAITEAQKRASANWNKKHLATLGCTVVKDKADAFKAKCKSNGMTVNAVLVQFIESYINEESPEN